MEPSPAQLLQSAVLGLALLSAGCGRGECTKFGGCPSVDRAAGAADNVVELGTSGVATLSGGATASAVALAGGEVIFAPQVRDCVATSGAPCRLSLERLRIRLADFDLMISDGSMLAVRNVVVSLNAPLELQDDGAGYSLPQGAVYQTCATIDGRPQSGTAASRDGTTVLGVGERTQDLSLDGSFVMALHGGDVDCTEVQVPAAVSVGGVKPWMQVSQ